MLSQAVTGHIKDVGIGLSEGDGGIVATDNHIKQTEQLLVIRGLEVEVFAVR